jgi:probable phosphoglycerate mutase
LLYLVRHGEQRHAASGDEPDAGLSALGEEQARCLGHRLGNVAFDVLRHSPLRRAAETARVLSDYLPGVPVSSSELLADRTPVPAAGHEAAVPAQYRWFLDAVPAEERDPGGAQLDAAVAQLAVAGDFVHVRSGEPPALVTFNDIGHLPVDLRGRPPVPLRS